MELKDAFQIRFSDDNSDENRDFLFSINIENLLSDNLDNIQFIQKTPGDQAFSCVHPAVLIPEKKLCLTGLCSVLRFILKRAAVFQGVSDLTTIPLLGYQGRNLTGICEDFFRKFHHQFLVRRLSQRSSGGLQLDQILRNRLSEFCHGGHIEGVTLIGNII